jgi:predicted RNA-binding Zn-ribbon protein involved in translation (DUF1610 family)
MDIEREVQIIAYEIQTGKEEFVKGTKRILALFSVANRSKTKKVSSDGVIFKCDNCGFEPQMASITDDLLIMHYCPKCGIEFE